MNVQSLRLRHFRKPYQKYVAYSPMECAIFLGTCKLDQYRPLAELKLLSYIYIFRGTNFFVQKVISVISLAKRQALTACTR